MPITKKEPTDFKCKKCGSMMYLIEGYDKYDGYEFFGCSNYPKCDYTENAEPDVEDDDWGDR